MPNNEGTWMDTHHAFTDLLDQAVAVPVPAGGMLAFHAAYRGDS